MTITSRRALISATLMACASMASMLRAQQKLFRHPTTFRMSSTSAVPLTEVGRIRIHLRLC